MLQPEAYEVTSALDLVMRQSRLSPAELRLLAYMVEQGLAPGQGEITQKTIAADIFGRDLRNFDPHTDSVVRTTAANLRDSLLEYYAGPGRHDPVVIELPKGTYVPKFSRRLELSAVATSRLWSARVALESRTVSGYQTALTHLDTILAEAPELSLALALKAEALAGQAVQGSRPRPCLARSTTSNRRAVVPHFA
jgi:hypothetical protein